MQVVYSFKELSYLLLLSYLLTYFLTGFLNNKPIPFPCQRSYEATKPGFSIFCVYFVL